MSRSRTPLGVRLLVVCELLLIAGWICLLFQWQPGVVASVPLAVATPVAEYRALSHDIDEQLAQARAAAENEGVLEMAFWPGSDLASVFVEPAASAISPAPELAAAAVLPNPISHGEFGLTNPNIVTVTTKPVPSAPSATRANEPAARPERHEASPPTAPACPYRITSIIRGANRSTVVFVNTVTGESLFKFSGEQLGEWRIVAINESSVELQAADIRRVLTLE